MEHHHFFAMLGRMKYISRWGLMRNTQTENISEHSHQVAVFSHALAVIGNKEFARQYDPARAALLGLYHDAPEIITGDLPTPIKYHNPEIMEAYKEVERLAGDRLLRLLPQKFREEYSALFHPEEREKDLWLLVKAADRLSALVKCIEEEKAGNSEFTSARKSVEKALDSMQLPEAEYFRQHFLESFSLTLDEHTKDEIE